MKTPFLSVCLFLGLASSLLGEEGKGSAFKETESALKEAKNKTIDGSGLELEAIGLPSVIDPEYRRSDIELIDRRNRRVLPSKKNQTVPKSYGSLPVYGLTGLFYQPKLRSAKILSPNQWAASVGFQYSEMDFRDSDTQYRESTLDLDFVSVPLTLSYGMEWAEIQVTAAVSELSGELNLIDQSFSNKIHPVDPSYAFDDIQVDLFVDLDILLWRQFKVVPKVSKKGSHLISIGLKLPTGSTHEYLSSGGADFSIGSYNSYNFYLGEQKVDWDVSAQLVLVGSTDDVLFANAVDSRHFFAFQSIVSSEIFDEATGFVGLGYRTKSLDGPFEAYENQGLEYFLGLRREIVKEGYKFRPSVMISGLDSKRLALQANLGFSY